LIEGAGSPVRFESAPQTPKRTFMVRFGICQSFEIALPPLIRDGAIPA